MIVLSEAIALHPIKSCFSQAAMMKVKMKLLWIWMEGSWRNFLNRCVFSFIDIYMHQSRPTISNLGSYFEILLVLLFKLIINGAHQATYHAPG